MGRQHTKEQFEDIKNWQHSLSEANRKAQLKREKDLKREEKEKEIEVRRNQVWKEPKYGYSEIFPDGRRIISYEDRVFTATKHQVDGERGKTNFSFSHGH